MRLMELLAAYYVADMVCVFVVAVCGITSASLAGRRTVYRTLGTSSYVMNETTMSDMYLH